MPWHPQILADQLTLSQPGSRLYPPHYYLPSPRIFRPSYGPESSGEARVFVLNFQYVIFPSRSPSAQMTEFLCKTFVLLMPNIKNANSWKVSFKSILCRQKTRAAKGIRKLLPQHNSALKLFFTSFWQKCVCFS